MMDCRLLLARNMKKYRRVMGLSQLALAEKVGCSTTLVGNIETCRRFPSADNINRIAESLGIAVAELFVEEEPSPTATRMEESIIRRRRLEKEIMEAISRAFFMEF